LPAVSQHRTKGEQSQTRRWGSNGPARWGRGGARSRCRYDSGRGTCALGRQIGLPEQSDRRWPNGLCRPGERSGLVRSSCVQKFVYLKKFAGPECLSAPVAAFCRDRGDLRQVFHSRDAGSRGGRVERANGGSDEKLPHRRPSRKQVPHRSMIWRANTRCACPILSGINRARVWLRHHQTGLYGEIENDKL